MKRQDGASTSDLGRAIGLLSRSYEMANLTRLVLVVHVHTPRDPEAAKAYWDRWEDLFRTEGAREDSALCMLSSSNGAEPELTVLAQKRFGDRFVLDPRDASEATQLVMAEDLAKTLSGRGRFDQWVPYEIWTSSMARRWTEGLKRELAERGHTWDPGRMKVLAFGQQWGGCLTKYAMFMPRYLGVTQTPDVLAECSPDAGWPLAARFIERVPLERHVSLWLFETHDGRPMAQFLDGLRAVWEPGHRAVVPLDRKSVEFLDVSPNGFLQLDSKSGACAEGFVADVGDGCQPRFTTILGSVGGDVGALRDALSRARIEPR